MTKDTEITLRGEVCTTDVVPITRNAYFCDSCGSWIGDSVVPAHLCAQCQKEKDRE